MRIARRAKHSKVHRDCLDEAKEGRLIAAVGGAVLGVYKWGSLIYGLYKVMLWFPRLLPPSHLPKPQVPDHVDNETKVSPRVCSF